MDDSAEPKKVGSYDNKGSFGELALMYNMPRAATITVSYRRETARGQTGAAGEPAQTYVSHHFG